MVFKGIINIFGQHKKMLVCISCNSLTRFLNLDPKSPASKWISTCKPSKQTRAVTCSHVLSLLGLPPTHLSTPSCCEENPATWAQETGDTRSNGPPITSCRSGWRFAWTLTPCSETEKNLWLVWGRKTNL